MDLRKFNRIYANMAKMTAKKAENIRSCSTDIFSYNGMNLGGRG
ncbi:MAG: hypothetical protein WCE90_04890 [Candidatus Zixiibacteriota bacterium]